MAFASNKSVVVVVVVVTTVAAIGFFPLKIPTVHIRNTSLQFKISHLTIAL